MKIISLRQMMPVMCVMSFVLLVACSSRASEQDIDSTMKNIKWYGFGSFRIDFEGTVLYVDPNTRMMPVKERDADFILITHGHEDNYIEESVKELSNDKTKVILPSQMAALAKKINPEYTQIEGMASGDILELGDIEVQAVPAYNTDTADAAPVTHSITYGWLGYVLTMNKVKVYITGGTSIIPEMEDVRCDIILGDFYLGADDPKGLAEAARRTNARMIVPAYLYPAGALYDEFDVLLGALPKGIRMTVMPLSR